ncbi:MAG: polyphenol oxidase family protein [Spirochaetes bacterium]|nr:polyphenol oxidase family protein [Spirochaetota bacterium]
MSYNPEQRNLRRDTWLQARRLLPGRSIAAELIHSRQVFDIGSAEHPEKMREDGIVCSNKSVSLVLTVADCMPIFLYDPEHAVFGLLHSGWKGTGILENAVRLLRNNYKTEAERLLVCFGPHIGPCCYQVDQARAALFSSDFGPEAVSHESGSYSLNLLQANLAIARRLGIRQLAYTRACTCCDQRFGSYRRQGAAAFSRMAAVIGWPQQGGRA